jgi:hypothetical protein
MSESGEQGTCKNVGYVSTNTHQAVKGEHNKRQIVQCFVVLNRDEWTSKATFWDGVCFTYNNFNICLDCTASKGKMNEE